MKKASAKHVTVLKVNIRIDFVSGKEIREDIDVRRKLVFMPSASHCLNSLSFILDVLTDGAVKGMLSYFVYYTCVPVFDIYR